MLNNRLKDSRTQGLKDSRTQGLKAVSGIRRGRTEYGHHGYS